MTTEITGPSRTDRDTVNLTHRTLMNRWIIGMLRVTKFGVRVPHTLVAVDEVMSAY